MSGAPTRMLSGPRVFRIVWLPGTDQLRGTCFCGADHDSEDPIELWAWLLAHPDSHGDGGPVPKQGPEPEHGPGPEHGPEHGPEPRPGDRGPDGSALQRQPVPA